MKNKSQPSDHARPVSAELIQAYLEGKLPAAEAHALERAALDDPFLAEAIEGAELVTIEGSRSVNANALSSVTNQSNS